MGALSCRWMIIFLPILVFVIGFAAIASLFIIRAIQDANAGLPYFNPPDNLQEIAGFFPQNVIYAFCLNLCAYLTMIVMWGRFKSVERYINIIVNFLHFLVGVCAMLALSLCSAVPYNGVMTTPEAQVYVSVVQYVFYGCFLGYLIWGIVEDCFIIYLRREDSFDWLGFIVLVVRILILVLLVILGIWELIFRILYTALSTDQFILYSLAISSYLFLVFGLVYILTMAHDFYKFNSFKSD